MSSVLWLVTSAFKALVVSNACPIRIVHKMNFAKMVLAQTSVMSLHSVLPTTVYLKLASPALQTKIVMRQMYYALTRYAKFADIALTVTMKKSVVMGFAWLLLLLQKTSSGGTM